MILEFGASMIIDRPVYGLLRRRSVAKWSMTMLVPNSNFIIWIYCMDCPKFCFHFKSCTVRQSVLFCFKITFCFFILDANYASTSRWIHGRFPHHLLTMGGRHQYIALDHLKMPKVLLVYVKQF